MFRSKNITWIIFAFCVTTGSCGDFYKKIGEEVKLDCPGPILSSLNPEVIDWKLNKVTVLSQNRKSGRGTKGGLDTSKRAQIVGTALKISQLTSSDVGIYTCNQFTPSHTLYVASAQANPPAVLYSSETHLTCDVQDFKKGTYQWLTPGSTVYAENGIVTVKPVTREHSGSWTCKIKNEKGEEVLTLTVELIVVGPLNTLKEVRSVQGDNAEFPCFLPTPSRIPITGGSWTRDTPTNVRFPALMSNQDGLQWNNTDVSTDRVSFSKEKLKSDFNVTLKKVRFTDAGEYTCRLEFQDGSSLNAKLNLTVSKRDGAAPDIDNEDPNSSTKNPWHKKNVWGLQLWIWVAVAASSLVLIGLVVIIVLIHRRNKRMKRKIKKTKSMQQPLTSRNYCKCDRTVGQPGTGRKGRPPPLPRHQYSALNN